MKIIYARESIPKDIFTKSIFLAGPTPRSGKVKSWRLDALGILKKLNFDGCVFVPEPFGKNYQEQINWEWLALEKADCILFWIPRNLDTLPGFTTNIEFGFYASSGKAVVGMPPEAVKTKYISAMCERFSIPNSSTLQETIHSALTMF